MLSRGLFVLVLGACSSSSIVPPGIGDVGVVDAEPLCQNAGAFFDVPSESQCPATGVRQPWAVDMVCRGSGAEVLFYVPGFRAHSATCETNEDAGGTHIVSEAEGCPERERPPSAGSLWPCESLPRTPAEEMVITIDGNPVLTRADTCTIANRNYYGCATREEATLDTPFRATNVCLVDTECTSASLRVSGPQIDVDASERSAFLFCDDVSFRDGSLQIQVSPGSALCFNVAGIPNDVTRQVDCPLPPSLPRRRMDVLVNGAFVDVIDLSAATRCSE